MTHVPIVLRGFNTLSYLGSVARTVGVQGCSEYRKTETSLMDGVHLYGFPELHLHMSVKVIGTYSGFGKAAPKFLYTASGERSNYLLQLCALFGTQFLFELPCFALPFLYEIRYRFV